MWRIFSFFQCFVFRNWFQVSRTWALFHKVIKVPMFGVLGHQDKNFWRQKTLKNKKVDKTWILLNISNFDDPITGESWRYPEIKQNKKTASFGSPGHVRLIHAIYKKWKLFTNKYRIMILSKCLHYNLVPVCIPEYTNSKHTHTQYDII